MFPFPTGSDIVKHHYPIKGKRTKVKFTPP